MKYGTLITTILLGIWFVLLSVVKFAAYLLGMFFSGVIGSLLDPKWEYGDPFPLGLFCIGLLTLGTLWTELIWVQSHLLRKTWSHFRSSYDSWRTKQLLDLLKP